MGLEIRTFPSRANGSRAVLQSAAIVVCLLQVMIVPDSPGEQAERTTSPSPVFVRNVGQFATTDTFVARCSDLTLRAGQGAVGFQFTYPNSDGGGVYVRVGLGSPSCDVWPMPVGSCTATYSYFQGPDPADWHADVGAFGAVRYEDIRPGVSLVLRTESGRPKYDIECARAAALPDLEMVVEGGEVVGVDGGSSLQFLADGHRFPQSMGSAWQVLPSGDRRMVVCRFTTRDVHHYGFACEDCDPQLPLVIDPTVNWGTYVGSVDVVGGIEQATAIGVDGQGDVYVAGQVLGNGFPITPGAYAAYSTVVDDFLVRLRGVDGSLVYSTVFGGQANDERARDLAVDAQGRAVVVGWTNSNDFPTTSGALDRVNNSPSNSIRDAYILKMNAQGSALEFSTYLGDDTAETPGGVAIRPNGHVVVAGTVAFQTASYTFPTTPGSYQPGQPNQAGELGFVAELQSDGSHLLWSTLFGIDQTVIEDLALTQSGDIVVSGQESIGAVPVTPGAYYSVMIGPQPIVAFVARLSAHGSQLRWCSAFGGGGGEFGVRVALDRDDEVYVAGSTRSAVFPTSPGSFQPTSVPSFHTDVFVTRLTADGANRVYSTRLGDSGIDHLNGIAVDSSGVVTVSGQTAGPFFATPGAIDSSFQRDFFVTRLHPSGGRLLYSTAIGGLEEDTTGVSALTPTGQVVVAGGAAGFGFPTTPGAASPQPIGGQSDAVVAKLSLDPQGVRAFGRSTNSCRGPVVAGVEGLPQLGGAPCKLYCSGAPVASSGHVLVCRKPITAGVAYQGVGLFVDLLTRIAVLPAVTDAKGFAEVVLPSTFMQPGRHLYAQFLFDGGAACPGPLTTRSSSQALDILVQP